MDCDAREANKTVVRREELSGPGAAAAGQGGSEVRGRSG